MTDTPAVSVIVPCYNLGAYVTEAVDSVLAQTYPDFEIVVVNDGSTDAGTNAVLAALDRPRTTVLTTENRGLPAARNHAVQHARGRYVCALDADDRLRPQFLEKTIGVLERDPSVAFVSTWLECFGAERWIWRREALDAVGGYDGERFAEGDEDWDFWISLVERGFRGTIVPEVLFDYRQREDSMRRVAMQSEVRQRVWRNLLDKHRASYERFLPDVLLLMEDECGRLLLENWRLEREIESDLATLAARRAERDRLRAAAPAIAAEPDADLRRDLAYARAEVAALRASWSWSLTAPLRVGYDAWLTMRRGLGSMTGRRS